MLENIKLFATNTDRSTYEEGDNYTEPYVSLVDNGGDLSYNHIFLLTDKIQYPYPNGKEKATVVYTRTFTSSLVNNIQPWCLPFDYTITNEDKLNFTFKCITKIEDFMLINTEDFEGILLANTPYFIIPKIAGTFDFKAKSVKLNLDKPSDIIAQYESTNSIYNFYLVYTPFVVSESGYYGVGLGSVHPISTGSTFPAYRWYIKVVSKS